MLDGNHLSSLRREAYVISSCHGKTFGNSPLGCYTASHRVSDVIKKLYTHSYAIQDPKILEI